MKKDDPGFRKALASLGKYLVEKINVQQIPRVILSVNKENSKKLLGKTAHYDPNGSAITLFIEDRWPKDILRSFAHEMVHHRQNEKGWLDQSSAESNDPQYAQHDKHLRKMEKQAYLAGNMLFRDWEDEEKNKEESELGQLQVQ